MKLLDYFKTGEFPQQTIYVLKEQNSYNPVTGEMTTTWALDDSFECWVWQKSALQKYFSEKIIDELDLTVVSEVSVSKESIVFFDGEYYEVIYPDNILYANELFVIGLKRTEKPVTSWTEPEEAQVLGDFYGVL